MVSERVEIMFIMVLMVHSCMARIEKPEKKDSFLFTKRFFVKAVIISCF